MDEQYSDKQKDAEAQQIIKKYLSAPVPVRAWTEATKDEIRDLMKVILTVFSDAVLVGGYALIFQGLEMRATKDVDISVFTLKQSNIPSAWKLERTCKAQTLTTYRYDVYGLKLDVLVYEDKEFSRSVQERTVIRDDIRMASLEDCVLMKLPSDRSKDKTDITIIPNLVKKFDYSYIEKWANKLKLIKRWEDMLKLVKLRAPLFSDLEKK